MTHPFQAFALEPGGPTFAELLGSVDWEEAGKGRRGAVLVEPVQGSIPIVRTTTRYNNPAQRFVDAHRLLAAKIGEASGVDCGFNNALIEHYDERYRKMGFHCDQALDLAAGSSIAVYSCYKNPEDPPTRRLVIEQKTGEVDERSEIVMTHGSVIMFSLDTNQRFRHKIVPAVSNGASVGDNDWLGVTFRQSKTFIDFSVGTPRFSDGTRLELANEEQAATFFRLRGQENREVNFAYPELSFTVSASDLVPPVGATSR